MPLQSSGKIRLSEIASEFGGSTPHNLSEYYNRGSSPSSGQISIGDFYGQGALSFTHLGSLTDVDDMIYSGTVNAATVTTNDKIIVVGTAESYSGSQAFTVNGSAVTSHTVVSTQQSPNQYAGTYVGSIAATSGMAGDTTLTVAQTTNPGSGNSFRAGCAVFRLVNGAIHSTIPSIVSTTENAANGPRSITRSVTASSTDIIFVAGHVGNGDNTTSTLSTNSGTMTRYEGVSESFGSGEYAVVTGATNPTITLATTNSGDTQGMSIAVASFGY